jgi:hypothetical protein
MRAAAATARAGLPCPAPDDGHTHSTHACPCLTLWFISKIMHLLHMTHFVPALPAPHHASSLFYIPRLPRLEISPPLSPFGDFVSRADH